MRRRTCCYGYAVKFEGQQFSVEQKERQIRKWTEKNGHKFMGMYVDDEALDVRLTERPIFAKMQNRLDRYDIVVMVDISGISVQSKNIISLIEITQSIGAFIVFMKEGTDTFTKEGECFIVTSAVAKEIEKINEARYILDYCTDDNAP